MASQRYRVARALGDAELERVVKEDEELLREFGLRLLSVESGLQAAVEQEVRGKKVNPWNVLTFPDATWTWLRPILMAAREQRSALAK